MELEKGSGFGRSGSNSPSWDGAAQRPGFPRDAIKTAAHNGHAGVVEMLLEQEGIDVQSSHDTARPLPPLIWAAGRGDCAALRVILPNATSWDMPVPLIRLARSERN